MWQRWPCLWTLPPPAPLPPLTGCILLSVWWMDVGKVTKEIGTDLSEGCKRGVRFMTMTFQTPPYLMGEPRTGMDWKHNAEKEPLWRHCAQCTAPPYNTAIHRLYCTELNKLKLSECQMWWWQDIRLFKDDWLTSWHVTNTARVTCVKQHMKVSSLSCITTL